MPENIALCHEILTELGIATAGPFAPLTLADRLRIVQATVETLRAANAQLRADVGGGETAIRYLEQENEHLQRERDEAVATVEPAEDETVAHTYACECGADSDPGACGHHPKCPALRRPLDDDRETIAEGDARYY